MMLETSDPRQTQAVAAALGRTLTGGEVIALRGALGAGKTQFVKGLAAGLDVPPEEPVVSPTFVLVREYAGRLRLIHIDAYRLHAAAELADLGLDEILADRGAVVAVEWADRAEGLLPSGAIGVELEHIDNTHRRLRLAGLSAAAEAAIGMARAG
ncbi:tRNA threonylcarbamoyladenosine biosynthesis protein TsaE [Phycisphaerae bacterium RAS1]|nr:tRNA threonylcarbamoyladenosine biosynthesis protein TsaE [Phycisphaerae bacterium RAS1]